MKKTLVALMLIGVLVVGVVGVAFAAEYDYYFNFPGGSNAGSAKYTSTHSATTSPYVEPAYDTAETSYTLVAGTKQASKTVTSTGRYRTFTYLSGHGGDGNTYRMCVYPTSNSYGQYTVEGTWSP